MQDNENIIRPVDNTQNIGSMKPIDRFSERRRRQNQSKKHSESNNEDMNEEENNSTDNIQGSIDYRA